MSTGAAALALQDRAALWSMGEIRATDVVTGACDALVAGLDSTALRTLAACTRAEGHEIREEDIARLSPLKHRNLNLLGRYSFTASVPVSGTLRPLRDAGAPDLDEDDDGQE